MKKAREDADYISLVPRITDITTQQLADANTFVALLAQVPAASPKPLPPSQPKICQNCGAVI